MAITSVGKSYGYQGNAAGALMRIMLRPYRKNLVISIHPLR